MEVQPITDFKEIAPVYTKYQGQFSPQPAFIELDCRNGRLRAEYDSEIGGAVPMYHYLNLTIRWSIPPEASASSIEKLFKNQSFLDRCDTILDGFEEVSDGSNTVGRYSDAAQEAIEEAEELIKEEITILDVCEPEEWLLLAIT